MKSSILGSKQPSLVGLAPDMSTRTNMTEKIRNVTADTVPDSHFTMLHMDTLLCPKIELSIMPLQTHEQKPKSISRSTILHKSSTALSTHRDQDSSAMLIPNSKVLPDTSGSIRSFLSASQTTTSQSPRLLVKGTDISRRSSKIKKIASNSHEKLPEPPRQYELQGDNQHNASQKSTCLNTPNMALCIPTVEISPPSQSIQKAVLSTNELRSEEIKAETRHSTNQSVHSNSTSNLDSAHVSKNGSIPVRRKHSKFLTPQQDISTPQLNEFEKHRVFPSTSKELTLQCPSYSMLVDHSAHTTNSFETNTCISSQDTKLAAWACTESVVTRNNEARSDMIGESTMVLDGKMSPQLRQLKLMSIGHSQLHDISDQVANKSSILHLPSPLPSRHLHITRSNHQIELNSTKRSEILLSNEFVDTTTNTQTFKPHPNLNSKSHVRPLVALRSRISEPCSEDGKILPIPIDESSKSIQKASKKTTSLAMPSIGKQQNTSIETPLKSSFLSTRPISKPLSGLSSQADINKSDDSIKSEMISLTAYSTQAKQFKPTKSLVGNDIKLDKAVMKAFNTSDIIHLNARMQIYSKKHNAMQLPDNTHMDRTINFNSALNISACNSKMGTVADLKSVDNIFDKSTLEEGKRVIIAHGQWKKAYRFMATIRRFLVMYKRVCKIFELSPTRVDILDLKGSDSINEEDLELSEKVKSLLQSRSEVQGDVIINGLEAILSSNIPSFKRLPWNQRLKCCQILELKKYPPGKVIIMEGHRANAFYFILSGKVEIFKGWTESWFRINFIKKGGSFGDRTLTVIDDRRTASVSTVETTEFLCVDKREFLKLIETGSAKLHTLRTRQITQLPDFTTAPQEFIEKVLACAQFITFDAQQVIINEDAPNFHIFWILSGSCRCIRTVPFIVRPTASGDGHQYAAYAPNTPTDPTDTVVYEPLSICELTIGEHFPSVVKPAMLKITQSQFGAPMTFDRNECIRLWQHEPPYLSPVTVVANMRVEVMMLSKVEMTEISPMDTLLELFERRGALDASIYLLQNAFLQNLQWESYKKKIREEVFGKRKAKK
ncbi:hypothetical protein O5D80_004788 [Batrachochytrium dendrobatidis]|nr:hypothetical protein O5D80_004788 [Batrachochytrium dendrobatidis]